VTLKPVDLHAAPLHVAARPGKAGSIDDAHKAASQLEAFFLRQMLTEAMPSSSSGGALDGGFAGDTFKQMLNEAIADKASAAGGVGIADMMAKQLTKPTAGAAAQSHPSFHALRTSAAAPPSALRAIDSAAPTGAPSFVMPVAGRPTSGFGMRNDPVHGSAMNHPGFDLAAATGTPVGAAAAGTITHAGPAGTYGNLVIVRHASGYETRYAHLSAVTVKVGEEVAPGQNIGKVGTTGYSTGPHLHFEVRHDGTPIDPEPLLPLNPSRTRTTR
jgi:murein DD-endopeptidase MepM/ murein hydrolase activator NlpD